MFVVVLVADQLLVEYSCIPILLSVIFSYGFMFVSYYAVLAAGACVLEVLSTSSKTHIRADFDKDSQIHI